MRIYITVLFLFSYYPLSTLILIWLLIYYNFVKVISGFNLCIALLTVQCRQCILGLYFQVPPRPSYSRVIYYAADRPVKENSLMGRFVDGTDAFQVLLR